MNNATHMLEVTDLKANYSGIRALRGVSLNVRKGEMVALIGPNGAGKSTLLNCISGQVRAASGSIRLEGDEVTGMDPWNVSRRGLLQVPEGRQVFAELSVLENLQLGATALRGRAATYPLERVFELFPILAERREQRAGSLSGGQQQMLAIGRALMGGPQLLLLDEPSLGLAPLIVSQVFSTLVRLNKEGLTILLIEQNAKQALEVTSRAYVLEQGHIVREGESRVLANDPEIAAHYLGQETNSV
jgi:branched-chain amino acid transport system ATP-binding protein